MGDMGEIFNLMQKSKKERHAKWNEENREILS